MLKRKVALTCMAVVILGTAGFALAKAVKVGMVATPYARAQGLEGARGKVILNYAKGADKTEIQYNGMGLAPNTETRVYLLETTGGWQLLGTATSDENGDVSFHISRPGKVAVSRVALNQNLGDGNYSIVWS